MTEPVSNTTQARSLLIGKCKGNGFVKAYCCSSFFFFVIGMSFKYLKECATWFNYHAIALRRYDSDLLANHNLIYLSINRNRNAIML